MRSLLCVVVASLAACSGGGGGGGGGGDEPGDPDDGGKGDAPVDPAACPAGPEVAPHEPAALALYPAPREAQIGEEAADVATACVDTHALAHHARLDALVPARLAARGLAEAPLDCGCDYVLYFAAD